MRLDPKYFNLFIAVCAVITLIVIVYGTISYVSQQEEEFEAGLIMIEPGEIDMAYIMNSDSLSAGDLAGKPVIIQFWATWSGKSTSMHGTLESYMIENENLAVVAAAVRDDNQKVRGYISDNDYPFVYTDGTDLYHRVKAPGVPSFIFIDSKGGVSGYLVGNDESALQKKTESLLSNIE